MDDNGKTNKKLKLAKDQEKTNESKNLNPKEIKYNLEVFSKGIILKSDKNSFMKK